MQKRKRIRNQARTALRNDLAKLFIQGNELPPNFLRALIERVRDLELATEADAEATLIGKIITNAIASLNARLIAHQTLPPHHKRI